MMKGFQIAQRRCGRSLSLILRLSLIFGVIARFQTSVDAAATVNSDQTHKIQVRDAAVAEQIEALGGTLIANYGSYRLYEVAKPPPQLATNPAVEMRDGYNSILLHAGHLDTRKPQVKALRKHLAAFTGKHLHLVQFAGPVQPQWRDELLAAGVQMVNYIPENTYLVYGDAPSLARVQAIAGIAPHIQWEGTYADEYKIHPRARNVDAHGKARNIGTDMFDIQLMADPAANAKTLLLLNRLKLQPIERQVRALNFVNLVVRLDPQELARIAAQPDVVSILPFYPRKRLDERQDQIVAGALTNGIPNGPGYLAWLGTVGFTQAQFTNSNFAVDLSDSGVDNGTTSPGHFGLYVGGNVTNASRIVYNRYESTTTYPSNTLSGCDGHGNLNAHIIGGYDDFSEFPFADTNGFHYGLGVCPFVNIGSSVIFDPADQDNYYFPNFNNLQADAYNGGARISNNSWGGHGSGGIYDSEAQNYDALVRDAQPTNSTFPTTNNQEMVIVFAAGNDGANGPVSVDTPATAKNVITVGAGENVQAIGGSDRSQIPDSAADDADDVATFSGRGPTADGRFKPDIMAPGTHVSGGVPQATNDFLNFPNGIADSCFDGSDVSGGSDSIYFPDGQQFYTVSSGTSHSAPAVSGGCALIRQYFINNFTNPPSPAMTKAFLLNSARYMTGLSAGDTLPSPNQGMGEMNLGMAFDGTAKILRDQRPADLFTNSGQTRAVTGFINDTNKPFRVTVAWTDAPGSLSGIPYNNNLDLLVTIGGTTYKGNVFNGAYSTNGGTADVMNNVESVFLPAGVSGSFVVTVAATSINSIGVPNDSNILNQDFALVVYNATEQSMPVVVPAGSALTAESCLPTNGIVDPGETVTVNFTFQNIGTLNFTNLVATLLTNSGVHSPSAPQSYGALAAAGAPVSQPFTFTAAGTCGGSITAMLQLQDGTNNLGTFNFTMPLGQVVLMQTFSENFDTATIPAIPTNWLTSSTGAQSNWMSSSANFVTAPNALFIGEPDMPGVAELDSPVIPIMTAFAQLSFSNFYDLESLPAESPAPSNGFDGGVLEISVDGGPYQDILAAGGSFVSGGYTAPIPGSDDNPLDGRSAWTGNSGGFISTVINLPASVAGHNIQVRWLCGTDSGNVNGGTGWYIDAVSVMDGYYSCCQALVPVTISNPQIVGTNLTFSFPTVSGQSYSVQYKNDLSDPGWMSLQSLTGNGSTAVITNSLSLPKRFYRVTSP